MIFLLPNQLFTFQPVPSKPMKLLPFLASLLIAPGVAAVAHPHQEVFNDVHYQHIMPEECKELWSTHKHPYRDEIDLFIDTLDWDKLESDGKTDYQKHIRPLYKEYLATPKEERPQPRFGRYYFISEQPACSSSTDFPERYKIKP